MRFLVREQQYKQHYSGYYYKRKTYHYIYPIIVRFLIIWVIAYFLSGLFLYFRQEYIIYNPKHQISKSFPTNYKFNLDYENIWINIPNSQTRIHGWWIEAPALDSPVASLSNEPVNILTTPKTMLYFGDRGENKTNFHNLARIKGFQQLGFSVLAIDYRGYGLSKGRMPNESRLYEDSQTAWKYLTTTRHIAPQDIVIYGESLGGAIAINLATTKSNAAGLIVQSSFTSMVDYIKQIRPGLRIFPLRLILHQRFDSISKVRSLAMPVLFLHGTLDRIVNYKMSRQLYYAAPEPKTLFFIPGGDHFSIYRPGKDSYLLAIKNFMEQLIKLN